MKEKVTISVATKEDETIFIDFCKKFHAVNIAIDSSTFKNVLSDIELSLLFRKILIDERFYLYFAFLNSIPVGYFLFSVINKKTDILSISEKYIFVEQIFLVEELRNTGIAGKMAKKIGQISQTLGIQKIETEVLFQNKTSQNFLKNLGGKIKSIKFKFNLK
jgi:predicted acetyltransferase